MIFKTLGVQRILDFDIENRPLTYLGQDFTTAEITTIAWSFGPRDPVQVRLLGRDGIDKMLYDFVCAYEEADVVTGHYIRVHDLPIINGALLENGEPGLPPKLSSDTKLDLHRLTGVSKSQESLSAMLGLRHPKVHMTQADWRAANRLQREELAAARCAGDVRQHQEMRRELVRRGLLRAPKMWRP